MANILDKNLGYVDRRRVELDVGRYRRCYETNRLAQPEMMKFQSILQKYSWLAWTILVTSWATWGAALLLQVSHYCN
jgi:hypothetical protein